MDIASGENAAKSSGNQAASRDVVKEAAKATTNIDVFGNSAHEYSLQGDHPNSIY